MPISPGNGDMGQRYAVAVLVDEEEGKFTPGWCTMAYTNVLESAQAIAESFVLRPNWSRTRIIDRNDKDNPVIVKEYREKK